MIVRVFPGVFETNASRLPEQRVQQARLADVRPAGKRDWVAAAPRKEGSWWPEWVTWLEKRSGQPVPPPRLAAPEDGYAALADAPGTYVLQE